MFICISNGNTFFNVLKNKHLIKLGEISYSTYLLHGILLYLIINNLFGIENTLQISESNYWLIIIGTTPILIILSKLTYEFIEKPFIQFAHKTRKKIN